jgi:hypothetical protein
VRPTETVRPSGRGHRAARRIDGRGQGAFRGEVCLDKGLDLAHERINALGATKIKRMTTLQSQKPVFNQINSAESYV